MSWKLTKLGFLAGVLVVLLIIGTVNAKGLKPEQAFVDLVAYYSFNRRGSTIIADVSDKGHDGLVVGELQWVTSRIGFGNALYFNGTKRTGYVNCGIWNPSEKTGQLTIALWIRWDGGGVEDWQGVISKRYKWAADQMMWQIGINKKTQEIDFYRKDSEPNCGDYVLPKGEWTHVSVTFDGTIMVFYINGEIIGQDSFLLGSKTDSPIIIGAADLEGWDAFCGAIDEVCIYANALNQEQIRLLYEQDTESVFPKTKMDELVEQTETMVKGLKPEEAVALLEKQIAYEKRLPSDMFYLLASSKEAAKVPDQDVIKAYKQSVFLAQKHSKYLPFALYSLFEKIPKDEYINVVEVCIRNSDDLFYDIYHIPKHFESVGNWSAFELFLDGLFSVIESQEKSVCPYAKVVAEALNGDKTWATMFQKYCINKPKLAEYIFDEQEKNARKYIAQGNFQKAVEIYRDIVKRCGPKQKKGVYELKMCECLFNNRQYGNVIQEIDNFIKNNATRGPLISKAIMLKGRSYVNLGDMDRAVDIFLTLMVEHPEAKGVSEANFFVGYCYMLQGQFCEATDAFNLLLNDYPESEYVDKARMYLDRIKSMTK